MRSLRLYCAKRFFCVQNETRFLFVVFPVAIAWKPIIYFACFRWYFFCGSYHNGIRGRNDANPFILVRLFVKNPRNLTVWFYILQTKSPVSPLKKKVFRFLIEASTRIFILFAISSLRVAPVITHVRGVGLSRRPHALIKEIWLSYRTYFWK